MIHQGKVNSYGLSKDVVGVDKFDLILSTIICRSEISSVVKKSFLLDFIPEEGSLT